MKKPGLDDVGEFEVVGEMAGLELELGVSAELGMQTTKNHLRSRMFVDLRDLVSIARGLSGARHLPLLVEFGTMDQLDSHDSQVR